MLPQTIILDLDGPILEGRQRHYACYAGILRELGAKPLPLADYWELKRHTTPLETQLAATNAAHHAPNFRRLWRERIEQPEFLALDTVQPPARETLTAWRKQGRTLFLATLRHHADALHKQLADLEVTAFFASILVCRHDSGGAGKAAAVRAALAARIIAPQSCLWVGDTEADITAARDLGCRVCAVTCGLRTEAYLAQLNPDYLAADLSQVLNGGMREPAARYFSGEVGHA